MRPNTSVRPPIIASARRQQLSDLLRAWRRQPRKRSPRLFWGLLLLAFAFDSALALLGTQLLAGADSAPATSSPERRMYVPYAKNLVLWEPLRRWAIRVDGRPQLFESFCRDAVRRVTGEERFEDNNALAVVVSWMLHNSAWEDYPFLRCEDAELCALLSRKEQRPGPYMAPAVLRRAKKFRNILRGITAKGDIGEGVFVSALERRAMELNNRLALFDRIRSGSVDGGVGAEMETARAALGEAYRSGDADVFAAGLTDFLNASRRALPTNKDSSAARRLVLEGWLNEHRPVRKTLYFSMLVVGLLIVSTMAGARRPQWRRGFWVSGLLACIGCLGWSAAGIVCRAMLHDGWPVSDGAEGMVWASSVVMSLALLLALRDRDGFIALAGALIAGAGFVLADRWPPAFAADWAPLPNLRSSDVWLRLQVLALISAYAALTLAWGVAILGLLRITLAPPTVERLRGLAKLSARSLGIAVVLLIVSAILDGFRTTVIHDSWRSWSIQTVSTLLILPCCAALLYVYLRGWVQPFGLMTSAVLVFTLIPMSILTVLHFGLWEEYRSRLLAHTSLLTVGLINLSLGAHAGLRYYFGKPIA